ncbi:unnamed protein product [Symbiodinium sp. CCMP2592]|nr:unnamed protein product [Symbiodinium sp. CCMP2592]
MSSHDGKSATAYTIAELSREFAGEFTKEEIQQHLQGDRALQQPSAKVCPSVFVAGLCWATTDDRLYDFFGTCGVVVSAEVFMDHCTGRSRGFGKVTFASLEAASKALSLRDAFLDGRPISVRPFDAIPPRRGGSDAPSFEVLVDSISWNTTETGLKHHFESCGDIVSCTVFYDRKTGQHKGIGKLVFASEAAASRATQRHLSDLDGWTISVRHCRTSRRKAAEAAERQRQGSGGTQEGPEGLPLSCTAIRNDALSATASFQDVGKTVDIPERVPTTHLIDWLAELDSAGFLLCYLPTLLTMGHRTARDVVHKYIEERPGGQTPQLAEQLFTDLQVQKLGHRRLFQRWFAGLVRYRSAATAAKPTTSALGAAARALRDAVKSHEATSEVVAEADAPVDRPATLERLSVDLRPQGAFRLGLGQELVVGPARWRDLQAAPRISKLDDFHSDMTTGHAPGRSFACREKEGGWELKVGEPDETDRLYDSMQGYSHVHFPQTFRTPTGPGGAAAERQVSVALPTAPCIGLESTVKCEQLLVTLASA